VVLEGRVGQLDQPVVVVRELEMGIEPLPGRDVLDRNAFRQRLEADRLQLADHTADLRVPVLQQRLPVAEVEPGPLEELRHARGDLLLRHADG
jgi:hypothetical protein